MDHVPVERVKEYEKALVRHLRDKPSEGMKTILETGKLEAETAEKLQSEIRDFNENHWKANKPEAAAAKA